MIDRSWIGKVIGAHTADVSAGQLKFFAKAVGEENPIYFDEAEAKAAGYPGLPAPPTFPFSIRLDQSDPLAYLKDMGVDLGRVLHGSQTFEPEGLIVAGDTITVETRIADIFDKKNGALEFIVEETTSKNQNGERVGRQVTQIVVRNG